ncbi:S1C family serine protease [Sporocytophaga myxococcoides]|uniref:S1C family serine protease n=1 Tax=Sporocytophaga myxococcoides TaxID=153721 RepID=UPI00041B83EC|nr:trypsin-like peptidase domain-containing protein [Sporocytophaga myxococcoides]
MFKKLSIVLVVTFSLSSCVAIFSSRYSKVNLSCPTPDVSIYSKGNLIGKGNITSKFKKKEVSQNLILKKEGYLDKNYSFNVQKKNPLRFVNLISIPTIYGPYICSGIDYSTGKKFQYNKNIVIPVMTPEPSKRTANQKYLQVNRASISIKKMDTLFVRYKNEKSFKAKKIDNVEFFNEDIRYEETSYNNTLTKFLKKYNFIDTTESIFPNYGNTSYIESAIEKVKFHSIAPKNAYAAHFINSSGEVLFAETQIKWIILDYYRVKLDSITITVTSDIFKLYEENENNEKDKKDNGNSGIVKALNNSVELSMVELLSKEKFKKLIEKPVEKIAFSKIKLKHEKYNSKSLNELIQASVTIKTGKDSHGSGFIISSDGYIVTNYHVVAGVGAKKVVVILNDGAKYDATIERTAPSCDLALLKVDAKSLPHMQIKSYKLKDLELGSDVSTIGTPKSVELGQSVAKGIVSGTRSPNENINYIQTNIAVNPGNSGGAFLDSKGNVIGVVTSKLVGYGVEGIAFAIPSNYIFDSLKLEY